MGGGEQFKIGKQRTLDKISLVQWGYANIKIMNVLIRVKKLDHIAELFSQDLLSVLLYDCKYRELQSMEGF